VVKLAKEIRKDILDFPQIAQMDAQMARNGGAGVLVEVQSPLGLGDQTGAELGALNSNGVDVAKSVAKTKQGSKK
jgi:hypothetical protein